MTGVPLILAPLAPLLLVALFAVPRWRAVTRRLVPLAPLPAFLVATAGVRPEPVAFDWLLFGTQFALTDLGASFLFFTALLWGLAGWSADRYLADDDPNRNRFTACFLLAMTGNLGLLIAQDVASFYGFFAIMSLSSWGLVVHEGGAKQVFAARIYISFAILGEVALFAGFGLGTYATGTYVMADLAGPDVPGLATLLIAFGFMVKLGVVPLHLWLPLAHSAAPAPASAVLSGAMLKAGLFGLMTILPLGGAAAPQPATVLAVLAIAGLVIACVMGLVQDDPKAVMAYSSVGQMSLQGLGLSAALAVPAAWPVIAPAMVLLAVHHGFAKAALFLGVPGVWVSEPGWPRRIALAVMAVPAAALIGIPGTTGFVAKDALKAGLAAGPAGWQFWLTPAVTLASAATACLMLRALWLLARAPHKPEIKRGVVVPWFAMTILAVVGLGLAPVPEHLTNAAGPSDLLPIAVALGLMALALYGGLRVATPQAGEIFALLSRAPHPVPAAAPWQIRLAGQRDRLRARVLRAGPVRPTYPQESGLAILVMAAVLALAALLLAGGAPGAAPEAPIEAPIQAAGLAPVQTPVQSQDPAEIPN